MINLDMITQTLNNIYTPEYIVQLINYNKHISIIWITVCAALAILAVLGFAITCYYAEYEGTIWGMGIACGIVFVLSIVILCGVKGELFQLNIAPDIWLREHMLQKFRTITTGLY